MQNVSRRSAIKLASVLAGSALAGGCKLTSVGAIPGQPDGRISARPTGTLIGTVRPGVFQLPETSALNSGLYFVPSSYAPAAPIPLVVVFHGASQQPASLMTPMSALAEELGVALLAIKSRDYSWDVIVAGEYGIDVTFLNQALAGLFSRVRIDPAKIGVAGFSDGATYALSLGRVNGDLFSRIAAFSPGGIAEGGTPTGKPGVYITHGTRDAVLPVSLTKNNVLPRLAAEGYAVEFHEFDGTHEVPAGLMLDAMFWLNRR